MRKSGMVGWWERTSSPSYHPPEGSVRPSVLAALYLPACLPSCLPSYQSPVNNLRAVFFL